MNKRYQQILLAVNLTSNADAEQAEAIAYQALRINRQFSATLSLVYAVKTIPICYSGQLVMDLDAVYSQIENEALDRMHHFAINFGISPTRQYALVGPVHEVIPRIAYKIQADLVVIGKHQRTGIAHFLNSKTKLISENTAIDILTVQVDELL